MNRTEEVTVSTKKESTDDETQLTVKEGDTVEVSETVRSLL